MRVFYNIADGFVKFFKGFKEGSVLSFCDDAKEIFGTLKCSGQDIYGKSGDALRRQIAKEQAERDMQKIQLLQEIDRRILD